MLPTDFILFHTILRLIPKRVKPNHVTVVRFILVPVVIYLILANHFKVALIVFSVAAFTDAIDGAMARTRDQITDWGKLYDPLADKLLIGSVAGIFVTRFLDPRIAVAVIFFELLLIVSALYRRKKEQKEVQALLVGKIKMIVQSFAVIALLISVAFSLPIFLTVATILLYAAIVFAVISLIVYRSI